MHLTRAVTLASISLAGSTSVSEQWANFKEAYGKTYHADEEQQRINIFRRNLEFIAVENQKNQGFTLGVTQFADLTNEEFAKTQGSTQRPASNFESEGHLGIHEASDMQLPDSLDWVQKGAVTGVKNQLNCGACWAFSAIGAMESHTHINLGKTVHLSEQQLVDCDTTVVPHYENRGCQGGWPSNAFMYAVNHSICTEDSYGYAGKNQNCRASSCEEGLPAQTILGFKNVQPDSEQALIEALQLGPVSVELNGNSIALQLYHGGIINGPLCGSATNHGVLVVGYTSDYFKVKNSWGNGWGESGYFRLGRGKGGHGECGFLTAPNYPVFANTSVIV